MGLARASISCLSAAVLLLVIRGPANWSGAFGAIWYLLFGGAVVFALAAFFTAAFSRDLSPTPRFAIVGLSLPALLAVPIIIWAIETLAPLAD